MSSIIRKDDYVYVLAGNDKGKTGVVLARLGQKLVVQGVNIRKKHLKRTQKTQTSQVVNIEMPIHISNVALCTKDGKKIKVKMKLKDDGSKDLIYQDEDKEMVYRTIKKKGKK